MALCFATNNEHKLEEVKALLPKNYPLLSLKDIDCITDLPETQETLQGSSEPCVVSATRRHPHLDPPHS